MMRLRLLALILFCSLAFGTSPAFASADTAPNEYRSTSRNSTKAAVATPGISGFNLLDGYSFINPNSYAVYVKLYSGTAGSVTVGTTVPVKIIPIPPGGYIIQEYCGYPLRVFDGGIVIAVTKNLADNDATALDTAIYAEVYYK